VSEVIAAITAAMTTGIAAAANIHVMRLCRQASRDGRAVEARFGLFPSIKIGKGADGGRNIPDVLKSRTTRNL
jgi:hypothetical protein